MFLSRNVPVLYFVKASVDMSPTLALRIKLAHAIAEWKFPLYTILSYHLLQLGRGKFNSGYLTVIFHDAKFHGLRISLFAGPTAHLTSTFCPRRAGGRVLQNGLQDAYDKGPTTEDGGDENNEVLSLAIHLYWRSRTLSDGGTTR